MDVWYWLCAICSSLLVLAILCVVLVSIIGRLQSNEDVFFYALTQNKLGNAYSELPSDDNAANLARAITCYREALGFFTPEETPFEYASTQGSLGNAYWKLLPGDRAANLVQAIAYYQEALRFLTLEDTPSEYAAVQNNLNFAYREM